MSWTCFVRSLVGLVRSLGSEDATRRIKVAIEIKVVIEAEKERYTIAVASARRSQASPNEKRCSSKPPGA